LSVKASQKGRFLICETTLSQKAGLNGLKHVFGEKYFYKLKICTIENILKSLFRRDKI